MVNLPTVVKSTETLELNLLSITPTQTEDGKGRNVDADEIKASFKHRFEFRTPLPSKMSQVTMDTTLYVYSSESGIIRFADRPQDHIPDNSVLSVSLHPGTYPPSGLEPFTISSHTIPSHLIPSHRIPSHRISSHLIPSHRISSHRISSHLIPSRIRLFPLFSEKTLMVSFRTRDRGFWILDNLPSVEDASTNSPGPSGAYLCDDHGALKMEADTCRSL